MKIKHDPSRRAFLGTSAKMMTAAALLPALGCAGQPPKAETAAEIPQIPTQTWQTPRRSPRFWVADRPERLLLKDGLIVDGTGKAAFYGDILISGDRIETITAGSINFKGTRLDCRGKAVAPGFIDCHSHMDWVLPMPGMDMKTPFTEQGVTTLVGGNCGFGVAGFQKKSRYRELLTLRTEGLYDLFWDEMAVYFDHLRQLGISHNLVNLAGHGTTRASIRGFDPTPMRADEMQTMRYLLDQAMEQGARGVSLGLQYEPGIFATPAELKAVAKLVKQRDGILTVHMKAYSALSGTYPLKLFSGRPHNLLALEEMIQLARETGVRLQLSHLIFVGERTWDTCAEALDLIENARREGLDIQYDTYAYHCGTSVINVFFPKWFLAGVPENYSDGTSRLRLRMEIMLIKSLLGFGYEDIQITDARHPDLNQYNGMFVEEIARERGLSAFDNFVDMARQSRGTARVLNHRYSSLDNVKMMMQDPAALFMTDATPAPAGVQNPGVYGNFPLFLQYARDYRLMTLEDCVRKMTGAAADRFAIQDRGYLKAGMAADITVFDYTRIRDNNTRQKTDQRPTGIEHVFINGQQVLDHGQVNGEILAGQVL